MSTTHLQMWLSSQQNISDLYETEFHEEDINCMGISTDINEESFKSLCVNCKKNHLKSTIAQVYSELSKIICKLALRILNSGKSSKSANKSYLTIRKTLLSKVLFMAKYVKEKESFENIQSFLLSKMKTLIERISEVFSQYKISDIQSQVALMCDSFILISRASKVMQPLCFSSEKCLKKVHQEHFYTEIMKDRQDIYKHLNVSGQLDTLEKRLLKKFKKLKNFDIFEELGDFSVKTHCCNKCYSEYLYEELQISLQDAEKNESSLEKKPDSSKSLTIDQIVEFIEGKNDIKSKKIKKRKNKSKLPIENFKDIDEEIEDFSRRLECIPAINRPKLLFSNQFIQELKAKIKIIKGQYFS